MIEEVKNTKIALEVLGINKKLKALEEQVPILIQKGGGTVDLTSYSTTAEADALYLKLDQSTPQIITGGAVTISSADVATTNIPLLSWGTDPDTNYPLRMDWDTTEGIVFNDGGGNYLPVSASTFFGSGSSLTGVAKPDYANIFTKTNTFPALKINTTGTTAVTTIGNTTIDLRTLRLDQTQVQSAGTMQPALDVYGNYTIDSATVVYPSAMKFYPTATVSASVSNNGYLIAFLMQPQLTLGSSSTYRMTAVDISPVINVQTGTGTAAFVSCFSARGVDTSAGAGTKVISAYYSYQAFNSAAGTITGQNSYAYWVKPNADTVSYGKYGFYCGNLSGAGFANYGSYIGTISGDQTTTYTGAVVGNFGLYINGVTGTHTDSQPFGNAGIYIGDVTGTRPYAIYTNAGAVRFGDTVLGASTIEATTGFKVGGTAAVADATYTFDASIHTTMAITTKGGIITAVAIS